MNSRHLHRCTLRFHRTASEAFKDYTYGACLERPAPKSGGVLRWVVSAALAFLALWLISRGA